MLLEELNTIRIKIHVQNNSYDNLPLHHALARTTETGSWADTPRRTKAASKCWAEKNMAAKKWAAKQRTTKRWAGCMNCTERAVNLRQIPSERISSIL
jgi:hypothetical protein